MVGRRCAPACQRRRIGLASRADPLLLAPMGHNKGKDNAKVTKTRRKKAERLKAAKDAAKASK